jgi:hypothetical protein
MHQLIFYTITDLLAKPESVPLSNCSYISRKLNVCKLLQKLLGQKWWYSYFKKFSSYRSKNTGYTQKNGAVSNVNKKFISHLTAGPRGQFPRWRRSRRRRSVCSVLRPPRSPDLTACDFFLWGFVKDSVYVPPLPMSLKELRDRITHALQTITADMIHRVSDEFDYRVGVCRVTQGAHIEGLWLTHEKLGQLPLLTVYVVPV